ncbi:MAG: ZIP family metal transporter, partial [Promethearchaeota archaeon]
MSFTILLWIIFFSFLGSIGTILLSSIFLFFKEEKQMSLISNLISYATGTLLAAALIGLIPHALEENDPRLILSFVLGGIILFFVLEKMIIWRHCHER